MLILTSPTLSDNTGEIPVALDMSAVDVSSPLTVQLSADATSAEKFDIYESNISPMTDVAQGQLLASLFGQGPIDVGSVRSSYLYAVRRAGSATGLTLLVTAQSSAGAPAPGNAWVQGGNTFGATGVIGTNDAFDLELHVNGSGRALFTIGGNILLSAGGENIELNANQIILKSNVVNFFEEETPDVTISQPALSGDAGNDGVPMIIRAQQGQDTTAEYNTVGGAVYLQGGAPGAGGSSGGGRQGHVQLEGYGATARVGFVEVDDVPGNGPINLTAADSVDIANLLFVHQITDAGARVATLPNPSDGKPTQCTVGNTGTVNITFYGAVIAPAKTHLFTFFPSGVWAA